jgi:hypothetical protein
VDDPKVRRRDEGLKFYLALTPPAEKDQRRLQFLGDVTAAQIDYFDLIAKNEERWIARCSRDGKL